MRTLRRRLEPLLSESSYATMLILAAAAACGALSNARSAAPRRGVRRTATALACIFMCVTSDAILCFSTRDEFGCALQCAALVAGAAAALCVPLSFALGHAAP